MLPTIHKDLKVAIPKHTVNRIVAIGDCHGCLDELCGLLDKVKLKPFDTVIFLGDYVDRGRFSDGVIRRIKALGEECFVYAIRGNHDDKVIRYHNHVLKQKENPDYKIPMKHNETYGSLMPESIEYLLDTPHAVFIERGGETPWAFCHAGLTYKKFDQDPQAFIRNRFISRDPVSGRLLPAQSKNVDGKWYVPEGAKEWYEYWDGRWKVVYGHSVYKEPKIANNTFGIDLGCCFGGYLCALILDPGEPFKFEYVKSNFKYEQQETEGA